jgi:hypothetical protein
MGDAPAPPLPVYALSGALDAVMALDEPGMLANAFTLRELIPDSRLGIGPFDVLTCLLPHWVPNAGLQLSAAGTVLAYTGDSGPDPAIARLARDADLLLAEATYPGPVRPGSEGFLSSAADAGRCAAQAAAAQLVLTHLWPGSSRDAALTAAAAEYHGLVSVAAAGLSLDLG